MKRLLVTALLLSSAACAAPSAEDGLTPAFEDAGPTTDAEATSGDVGATGGDAGATGGDAGGDTGSTRGDPDAGASGDAPKTGPAHPFGGHDTKYVAGSILPSAAGLDEATASFYDAWKKRYLTAGCGTGRYYVNVGIDAVAGGGKSGASISVSEGHGYGMMIVALMAGHDPDARTIFDGLYAFFRDHPSANSKDLMAWNQITGCKDTADNDSASDGDLDLAQGLLFAHAQWGSAGAIDYLAQAKKVIAAIKAKEIHPTTKLVKLGDWVTAGDTKYGPSTRPSDFHLDHFRAFGAATGDPFWTEVVDAHQAAIEKLVTGYASATGLLPDFVVNTTGAPKPAPSGFLEAATDGAYSWNACRVPWRLGTDFLVSGDARTRSELAALNGWIRGKTGGDPAKIDDGYQLSGASLSSGVAYELAFVAPFGVAAMSDAKNQAWLDAIWRSVAGKSLASSDYYGNSIKLLAMLVMSGNWVRA